MVLWHAECFLTIFVSAQDYSIPQICYFPHVCFYFHFTSTVATIICQIHNIHPPNDNMY